MQMGVSPHLGMELKLHVVAHLYILQEYATNQRNMFKTHVFDARSKR